MGEGGSTSLLPGTPTWPLLIPRGAGLLFTAGPEWEFQLPTLPVYSTRQREAGYLVTAAPCGLYWHCRGPGLLALVRDQYWPSTWPTQVWGCKVSSGKRGSPGLAVGLRCPGSVRLAEGGQFKHCLNISCLAGLLPSWFSGSRKQAWRFPSLLPLCFVCALLIASSGSPLLQCSVGGTRGRKKSPRNSPPSRVP